MTYFAVIMLVVILCCWHHLANWYLRVAAEEGEGGGMFVMIIMTIAITFGCIIYIIEWGAELT